MKRKILLMWVSIGMTYNVNAQEELSLSQAIELGLQNNYGILIEKKNVEIAENNNSWGEAGRYPSLTLSLGQNNSITDNVKTANPFQPQGISISNSVVPSANLDWTLFGGFKVNISKNRLAQLQQQSQGNADIVIANTIQAIILGYFNAVMQEEQLEVFMENVRLSRDKYQYLQIKKSYGAAVTSDLLLEEGNYLTDSLNFVTQQLTYRNAVRTLNTLLAVEDVERTYSLTDQLPVDSNKYDLIALIDKMTRDNVDLKKQYISQSILTTERKLQQAERYPQLSLNLGASMNSGRVDYSNATFPQQTGGDFSEPLTSITNNYNLNFRISYNLFNGGKINRAIKNAMIQEEIGSLQTENMKLSLRNDLSMTYNDYEVRKQIYGINKRKREAASLNLEISEQKFKNGTINSFDFRTIQNNYLQAAVQELQSRYNLLETNIGLLRLTGGIIESYTN